MRAIVTYGFLFLITLTFAPLTFSQETSSQITAETTSTKSTTIVAEKKKRAITEVGITSLIDRKIRGFIVANKLYLITYVSSIATIITQGPSLLSDIAQAFYALSGGRGWPGFVLLLGQFITLLGLAFLAEWQFHRKFKSLAIKLQQQIPECFGSMFIALGKRTILEICGFGIFIFTLVSVLILFCPIEGPLFETVMAYLPIIVMVRVSMIVLNFLFSPKTPNLRIVSLDCPAANVYFSSLLLLLLFGPLIARTTILLKEMGIRMESFLLLYTFMGIAQFTILIRVVWLDRKRVSQAIMAGAQPGHDDYGMRQSMAGSWPFLMSGFLFIIGIAWHINLMMNHNDLVLPMMLTIIAIPFGLIIFSAGTRVLQIAAGRVDLLDPRIVNQDLLAQNPELSKFIDELYPGLSENQLPQNYVDQNDRPQLSVIERHFPLIRKIMGILILMGLTTWVLNLWGIDLPVGQAITDASIKIFITAILGYAIWEVLKTVIDRKIQAVNPEEENEDMEEGGAGGNRAGTLLILLRKAIVIFIICVVSLIMLSAMGINIGPLLAGAGIIGIAVGFGAQTLVADIFSGIFFLVDDAFRLGDYVEGGDTKGIVEQISLRALQLRHPRGGVHTIPFSQLGSVTNFSRDWVIMKHEFRVPYNTNIDKVRKIVKKINKKIQADKELGPKLLDKIKSQGVKKFDGAAMIMRVKFKTKPGEQFTIRKELFKQLQEQFEANGIEFYHERVMVQALGESSAAGAAAAISNKNTNATDK
ncbi:mechanosensitive ion channel family protein [Desulfobacterales bacterium HSG17]|nr:mechanosensitive ion channel family protein [Desulfobacterales bacterium HSG17]